MLMIFMLFDIYFTICFRSFYKEMKKKQLYIAHPDLKDMKNISIGSSIASEYEDVEKGKYTGKFKNSVDDTVKPFSSAGPRTPRGK